MKFKVDQIALARSLDKLKNCLPTTAVTPIHGDFLFELKDGILKIKATDTFLHGILEMPVESTDSGAFTLPGKILSGLVKSLEKETVTFELDTNSNDVQVSCGNFEWQHSSGDVLDYPTVSISENLEEINLPSNFNELLNKVAFSISPDTIKPELNSLCLDFNKKEANKLSLVATDRIRFSCVSSEFKEFDKSLRFVIPKITIDMLMDITPQKLLFDKESATKLYFKADYDFGNLLIISPLTKREYPDIYFYLNNSFNDAQQISFKRNEFIKILKRLKMTSEGKCMGTLEFKKNKAMLSISAMVGNAKSATSDSLAAVYADEDRFKFNIDCILEYLALDKDEDIKFKLLKNKCIIFDKPDYRHVLSVMEAKIN